ncbi:hypothetical protein [uncultured Stenotrophomonas sp.]|uniref:hypothetical protein n=1 Tax=uncultured Stenotrophomonas sp. TaxID=165438 RepID=UPI0025E499EA|nr:hypothetical protein [uncultured Stenotrophomonas sp.]
MSDKRVSDDVVVAKATPSFSEGRAFCARAVSTFGITVSYLMFFGFLTPILRKAGLFGEDQRAALGISGLFVVLGVVVLSYLLYVSLGVVAGWVLYGQGRTQFLNESRAIRLRLGPVKNSLAGGVGLALGVGLMFLLLWYSGVLPTL